MTKVLFKISKFKPLYYIKLTNIPFPIIYIMLTYVGFKAYRGVYEKIPILEMESFHYFIIMISFWFEG